MCLVLREILKVMDVDRFIAEVRRRPPLWNLHCPQYKDRILTATLWQQVARNVNVDVGKCKRKWRNLRDAYRAEIRRIERRKNRDSILDISFNKNIYKSKWAHFDEMDFMRNYKRPSCPSKDNDSTSTTNSNGDDYSVPDNHPEDTKFHTSINIKMEPYDDDDNMADTCRNVDDNFDQQEFLLNADEIANDMMFAEFESIEASEIENSVEEAKKALNKDKSKDKLRINNTEPTENIQKLSEIANIVEKPKNSLLKKNTNNVDCKCSKRSDRHVHFLENFCKKKRKRITFNKRKASSPHIGDSDYNFLISFLPQMKKMTSLQNLQFRAKISQIVLDTLAPAIAQEIPQQSEKN